MLCCVWWNFMASMELQYGKFQTVWIIIGLCQNNGALTTPLPQPILHKFPKEKTLHLTENSQFLQMYIVLIAHGKESKLFWNVNAYFTKDVASPVHMYSRSQMKLKRQWSKYNTGKYTQFISVVKMTCWAMNW